MYTQKFNLYPFQYFPKYFNKINFLEEIKNNVTFTQENILVGKENVKILEKRKTCWLSDDENLTFEYSGKSMKPKKIPNILDELINKIYLDFGIKFDGILINYYENGNVGMGYHSDPIDEKWDNNFIIYSLGDNRKFIFREKNNIDNKVEYNFSDGDIIYMYDNCQDKYEHSVRKNKLSNERISLVFKKLK